MATAVLESEEITAAKALVALYDERVALTKAMAEHERPTGAMVDEIFAKDDELTAACEDFRRRYYPRRHRVFVGLSTVMACSKTGRSVLTIFDGWRDGRVGS